MIYELRIYRCLPGRLPALLKRFEDITLGFWNRYGIRQVGFWTTEIGKNNHELTYMLSWASLAEREEKWNAFQADPDWLKQRNATETPDRIVQQISNQILKPTAFSALT